MKRTSLFTWCFLVFLVPNVSYASLILGAATPTASIQLLDVREWGYDFTVGSSDVLLSRLGAYDRGLDGLTGTTRVSVWDRSDSSLVASADISGMDGSLVSNWRMVDITDVILSATGVYSFVASTTNTSGADIIDRFLPIDATSLGTVGMSFLRWEVTSSGNLVFPNRTATGGSVNAMTAINADISLAQVPEPATLALMGLGLAGIGYRRKRKLVA